MAPFALTTPPTIAGPGQPLSTPRQPAPMYDPIAAYDAAHGRYVEATPADFLTSRPAEHGPVPFVITGSFGGGF